MAVLDILTLARDMILEDGWNVGGFPSLHQPHSCCASVAIRKAKEELDLPSSLDSHIALLRAAGIDDIEPNAITAVYAWNDSVSMSQEEVLRVFDKAIRAESEAAA